MATKFTNDGLESFDSQTQEFMQDWTGNMIIYLSNMHNFFL